MALPGNGKSLHIVLTKKKEKEQNLPKNGFNGVDNNALIADCKNNMAECGTLNG
jgi:hypothetical protein